jgi:ferric-dicitrate binding protein FerR (iron transport regulator)
MKDQTEIKVLLERFHQGISTPDENLQLLRHMDNNSWELDKLAQKIWDESSEIEDDSEKAEVLKILHQKLGFREENQNPRIKPSKVFSLVVRYAAILIIGFGLAWLFFARNNLSSPASTNAEEFYKVTVAYGSKSTIELPDGSVVTLNSGSTLKYPGTFAASERTVVLDGEAFFDVKKNPSSPFLVKTKDITVRVLGTSFNVKSYSDENLTETTLVTGKVEIVRNNITNKAEVTDKPLVLTPNQKAVFYRESNTLALGEDAQTQVDNSIADPLDLKVLVQKEIKTEAVTSWKNNVLVFNSEPFNDIVKKLERWYNVEVTLKYSKLSPVVFSGKFDKESIQEVLHALSLIEPFKYEVNKNQILIYK